MNYDRFVMTINGEEHWAIDDLRRVENDALEAVRHKGRKITVNVRQDSPQAEPAEFYIDQNTDITFREIE